MKMGFVLFAAVAVGASSACAQESGVSPGETPVELAPLTRDVLGAAGSITPSDYLQKISVELLRGQGQFYSKVAEQCMDKQGFGAPVVEVGAPASGSSQGRGSGSAHRRGQKRDRDELEMGVGV